MGKIAGLVGVGMSMNFGRGNLILTIQNHTKKVCDSVGGISGLFLISDGDARGFKCVIQIPLGWVRKTHEGGVGYGYQLRPPQHVFYPPKQC